jgi:hypothetical protein
MVSQRLHGCRTFAERPCGLGDPLCFSLGVEVQRLPDEILLG